MRGDDYKFLVVMVVTVLLAGAVVYTSYLRDLRTSVGHTVDLAAIEELAGQGVISLEEASFYEDMEQAP